MNEFPVILALALAYGFLNGFHDSASIVATVIASRTLPPRVALAIVALGEFVGPLFVGTAVAALFGGGLLAPGAGGAAILIAALGAAILLNILTWLAGIPSSSSHALVGGLVGAALASGGPAAVEWGGLLKVLAALIIAPPLGLATGFLLMRFVLWLCRDAPLSINRFFRAGQLVTAAVLAMSHSGNDAQKTMAMIALGLVYTGRQAAFAIPFWAVLAGAGALALGSLIGAGRIIRTIGARVTVVRPVHAFTTQLAAAAVILTAALAGGPVSGTQVVGSALMGVGGAERLSRVRWTVGRDMMLSWVITIPICMALSAILRIMLFG